MSMHAVKVDIFLLNANEFIYGFFIEKNNLHYQSQETNMIHTNKKGDWFELAIPAEWESYTLETLFREFGRFQKN